MQWVGVAMVFGTMYVKSSDKKESGKGHSHGGGSTGAAKDKEPARLTDVKVEKVYYHYYLLLCTDCCAHVGT
jgi:hypothetical protein